MCIRDSVWCDVSLDCIALFKFCVMRHDSAKRHVLGGCTPQRGAMTPNSNSAKIFVQCTYPKFHPVFTHLEVIMLTNKQTPPKKSNVFRYAMTLGNKKNNWVFESLMLMITMLSMMWCRRERECAAGTGGLSQALQDVVTWLWCRQQSSPAWSCDETCS